MAHNPAVCQRDVAERSGARMKARTRLSYRMYQGLPDGFRVLLQPRSPAGYPPAKKLLKYSYPTCTFVILTARRLAVGLELGPESTGVPYPSQDEVNGSLTIWPKECLGGPGA